MPSNAPPDTALVDLALVGLLLGGERLDPSSATAKALKKALDHAVSEDLVEIVSERREGPGTDKRGRPKKVTVKHYVITARGRERALSLPHPDVRGISQAAVADQLRRDLAASVTQLRDELGHRIDHAFVNLSARLAAVSPGEGDSAEGSPTGSPTRSPTVLRDHLARAYAELCRRTEYSDALVDIPRLWQKVRQVVPTLSVEALHEELKRLWASSDLQLRVVNEVHELSAEDRALGIQQNHALHFYVYWPQEKP